MPKFESDQIQSWLELVCQMLPGAAQAVVVACAESNSSPIAVWPAADNANDELVSAARLAKTQNKRVITTLSAGEDKNTAVETIVALPIQQLQELDASMAVLVKIRSSQQFGVTQILQWGEDWLELLSRYQHSGNPLPIQSAGQ